MDKYAVFGNPIVQSRSPAIHRAFAQQFGQTLSYTAIQAEIGNFADSLEQFFADPEAKGCNVTAPFKLDAAQWVDELSEVARAAGAVNTIIRDPQNRFIGENTDGFGLTLDLARFITLKNKRVLLLGAGGAARGVLKPILDQGVASVFIANRTASKAEQLHALSDSPRVTGGDLAQASNQHIWFDLIINSTSASLQGSLPDISDDLIANASLVYDMVYASKPTPFLHYAKSLGVAHCVDGLGMLVGQAAQSFFLWRGVKPDIEPVLNQLRASL